MREAAERRQQLELEHEQALAVLNAKQQEIELLQKVSSAGYIRPIGVARGSMQKATGGP